MGEALFVKLLWPLVDLIAICFFNVFIIVLILCHCVSAQCNCQAEVLNKLVCLCVCGGCDYCDYCAPCIQRSDRRVWDPEVPATWDSGWTSASSSSDPDPQVPGQQRHDDVVQNVHVGCHLPAVTRHSVIIISIFNISHSARVGLGHCCYRIGPIRFCGIKGVHEPGLVWFQ